MLFQIMRVHYHKATRSWIYTPFYVGTKKQLTDMVDYYNDVCERRNLLMQFFLTKYDGGIA